jgi:streptogramin lyase
MFWPGTVTIALVLAIAAPGRAAEAPPQDIQVEDLAVAARIPANAAWLAFAFDALWVLDGNRLLRVDPADNSVTRIALPGNLGASYRAIGIGEGAVWIADLTAQTVHKVDPVARKVVRQIPASMVDYEGSIGVGEGGLWVVTREGKTDDRTVTRFNAVSGIVEAKIALPAAGAGVVVDYGFAWVTSPTGAVYRIDPKSNAIAAAIPLAHRGTRYIASAEGSIWVFNEADGTIQRIDAGTDNVVATIATGLPGSYGDISAGGGYLWANTPFFPAVQIDPATNRVLRRLKSHGRNFDARYGAAALWIAEPGSVLRVEMPK